MSYEQKILTQKWKGKMPLKLPKWVSEEVSLRFRYTSLKMVKRPPPLIRSC